MKKNKEKVNLKEFRVNFIKTWKYMKGHKKQIIFYIIISIILTGIGVIIPFVSAKWLLTITKGLLPKIVVYALIICLINFVRYTFECISDKISDLIYLDSLLDIQIDIAGNILEVETKEMDKNSSGVFIERLKGDSTSLARIFSGIANVSLDLLGNVGVFITIFLINRIVFIYSVFMVIILWLIEKKRVKEYFKSDERYRKINEKNTGLASELVRGMRDIKVLNIKRSFLDVMSNDLHKNYDEKYNMGRIRRFYGLIRNNIEEILYFGLIMLCVYLIKIGNLSIESFVILYTYSGRITNLLGYFTYMFDYFKEFNLSATRVFEVIDGKSYKKEQFGNTHIGKLNGEFEFKDVEFSYNKSRKIIKGMSFKINPNETVAFVGKSGAGKTTIFSLIDKLYRIDKGKILFDGINIDDLDQASIRNNISIITQEPYIFNFTIKENLKLVKPNATQKEIEEACKLACIDEYINNLPKKYNTLIGENGVTLSGGQKQRLAIARALLRKTEIILFDEATSALDNETQSYIQQAISNMKKEYTILIVAHRLSTIINADRILVVDDGKIVGEGTHQYLLNNNKIYKHLYETEIK